MSAVKPLAGIRVLVGRAPGQADLLAQRISELGGQPVIAPLIEIVEGDRRALVRAVDELAAGTYTGLTLTSPNGVEALASAMDDQGFGAEILTAVNLLACVGPGTAGALRQRFGVAPNLVPDTATTEALAHAFPSGSGRVLLPRADRANPVLGEVLRAKGYATDEVIAYRTVTAASLDPTVVADLAAGRIDLLAFASSSTVRGFSTLIGSHPWNARVISIGPVTSATCNELGIPVAVEAQPHDLDGLVAALTQAASDRLH